MVLDKTVHTASSPQLPTGEGYDIDTVHDTDVGLQQLATRVYDVVIIKASPDTESWRLCEEIRSLSGIPLIVISTNASANACVKAINAGADYFLRKPFGPMEFKARVESLLQRTIPQPSAPAIA